jgi:hypothetical protein
MDVMRKLVLVMWVPVLLAALYTGWVLWQRHVSARPAAPPATVDPLARYGGEVKILQFYTGTGTIAKGGKALLCYGVVNATAVRLDPAVESVWPAMSRCFDVAPARSTRYTLTAESADHKTVSATLDIVVKP